MKLQIYTRSSLILILLVSFASCESFLDIQPPKTQVVRESVFSNEATATSAVAGMYYQLATSGFASGDETSVTVVTGLSSDELTNYSGSPDRATFASNAILPRNAIVSGLWSSAYKIIYAANTIIEGVATSKTLSEPARKQLTGEAMFVRAFCHFYLTNLFGDVPISTSTDYRINTSIISSPRIQVIDQIIADLKVAEANLASSYQGLQRSRPNTSAAQALLARTYLYNQQWELASAKANEVINNSDYELLPNLDEVFLAASREAIWQLTPSYPGLSTFEGATFILTAIPRVHSLSDGIINSFEADDKRQMTWVGNFESDGITYYFPYKYKELNSNNPQEASIVLRLAELYFIRAEARVQMGDIKEAIDDINTIRTRAGLTQLSASVSKDECLRLIESERRVELFTEWGHRWFDLIRTNKATETLAPLKNPNWQPTDQIYPIPQDQIDSDPYIKQNPGY